MTSPLTFNPKSRSLRWSVAVVAIILLLALISALTLPSYLKNTLEQQVLAQTGRQFSVSKISFNPFTLTVNLSQLQLMEADKSTPAFAADKLMLRVSPASLFHLAPVVGAVTLTHPQLHLQRRHENGLVVTNFSDVLAKFAEHPSKGDPLRFSVSNIRLIDGVIDLDDRIAARQVHIDALQLGIPFLSNFPSALDIDVDPYLTATVDGSKFEIKGRSKPFSATLDTSIAIDIDQFNLTELLPFLPEPLPYTVKSAQLSTRLNLNFATANHDQRISLTGNVSLADVKLADHAGAGLFESKRIVATLADVNMVNQHIALSELEVVDPVVTVGLDQHGILNWMAGEKKTAPEKPATAAAAKTDKPLVELAHFQIKNGTVHWSDAANATPAMTTDIVNIAVDAQHLSTAEKAEPGTLKLALGGSQLLKFDGKINPVEAMLSGHLTVSELTLKTWQPYANRYLAANVSGTFGVQTDIELRDGNLSLNDLSASLDDLSVQANARELGALSVKKIALDKVTVNGQTRKINIAALSFGTVQSDIFRDANGQLNVIQMLKKVTATPSAQQGSTPSSPWQVDVSQINLADSHVTFGDKSVQPAVLVHADDLNIRLDDVTSTMQQPVKLALRATLNKTGKFIVDGQATSKTIQLKLDVQKFSLAALQPYFTQFLNIRIDQGSISTKAKLGWATDGTVTYQGGVQLANLATADKESSDDFLKWKMLDISGIDVSLGGKQPTITLGKINLNDFYARAILSGKGKLNLQDILVHAKPADATNPPGKTLADSASPAQVQTATAVQPAVATPTTINIGAITLNNGIINYTDNFIEPHYSMRMTGMQGNIGAIHSNRPESAAINLNGKVDDEAPIAITGSLNPLFSPMLLDIKMSANGINLPRLTTYSLKYAGYPIVKGQLSMDVEYNIKDNQLSANNSLKIDQLTFGDRVDGPNATTLPVPFLISLLTDGDGRINLDLPISGTINDPQFSMGGLIVKVFVNLMEKVISSPFTLLTHAMGGGAGGGDELAYIEFEPGAAALSDASKTKLDSLAKALALHPAIKLDMTGRADMTADGAGLKQHFLANKIMQFKNLEQEEKSDSVITAADRARAIDKIYSDAKFTKPRNVIGFAKTLPTAEMENLIIDNTVITDDDIRRLALRRESAVRAYLTDVDHVTVDRLFSVAPRLTGDGIQDKGAISRVDFDLKM